MKTDLLIIGGGLAGLTAAYEVLKAEPGRRITILRPGAGSSPYVHGFNMPLNPQDSTELFIQDTEASGRGQGNAALVEELCRGSLELLPFFDELGLDFNREADGSYQQLRPLGASCPRVISIGNDAGGAILRKLLTVMEQHENVSVCTTLHALRLITEDGRVCGAHCFDTQSNLDFDFLPVGIDIRKVLKEGVCPAIHGGMFNRVGGLIGAGMARVPMQCFEKALVAFGEKYL